MNVDTILEAYVACALWSSTDDGDNLDMYSADGIAPETLEQMREDVTSFVETVEEEGWDTSAWTDEQMGHDLWLTRNGHGAGFWDRGQGEMGERLSDLARPFGSFDLYVGDDGLVYGS